MLGESWVTCKGKTSSRHGCHYKIGGKLPSVNNQFYPCYPRSSKNEASVTDTTESQERSANDRRISGTKT